MQTLVSWGPAAAWTAVLFFLSELQVGPESAWLVVPDKVIHLLLYTVLGAALAWGRERGRWKAPHGLLIALGGVYGVLDEWHQSFVPGRTPSAGDVLADLAGVAFGYVLLQWVWSRRGRFPPSSST